MAETAITVQSMAKSNGSSYLADLAWTAGDAANGMSFVNNGVERVLLKNAHSGPLSVTFTSVADEHGRTGDVTIATTNAKESKTGYFPPHLFNNASGLVIITFGTVDTNFSLAVIKDA